MGGYRPPTAELRSIDQGGSAPHKNPRSAAVGLDRRSENGKNRRRMVVGCVRVVSEISPR